MRPDEGGAGAACAFIFARTSRLIVRRGVIKEVRTMFGDCVVSVRSSRRGLIFAAVLLTCVASAGYAQPGGDAVLTAQAAGNGEAARLLQVPEGAALRLLYASYSIYSPAPPS